MLKPVTYSVLIISALAILSSCIKEESGASAYSEEKIFYNLAPIVKADYTAYNTNVPFVSYVWRLPDGKSWSTDKADAEYYFSGSEENGEVVNYYSSSNSGIWTTDKAYLWSLSGSLSFFSYSPAYMHTLKTCRVSNGGEGYNVLSSLTTSSVRFPGSIDGTTLPTGFGFSVSKADSVKITNWDTENGNLKYLDLLVADETTDVTAKSGKDGVATIFHHPFAQVGVMFSNSAIETTSSDKLRISTYFLVTKVSISSIYTEGDCGYLNNGKWYNLGPTEPWSNDTYKNGGVKEFVLYDGTSPEGFTGNALTLTDSDNATTTFNTATLTIKNSSGDEITGVEVSQSGFIPVGWYRNVIPQYLSAETFYNTTSAETGSREAPELTIEYYEGKVSYNDDGTVSNVVWGAEADDKKTATTTLYTVSGNNSNTSITTSEYWIAGKRTTYYITFGQSTIPIVFDNGDIDEWDIGGGNNLI